MPEKHDLRFSDKSRTARMVQALFVAALSIMLAAAWTGVVCVAFLFIYTMKGIYKAAKNLVDGAIAVVWYIREILVVNWKD